ncbi:right-handed parallel beta-helix repeat-containing protein [Cohnella hongkongensis]|uniref:Right-handed parallel beta-helix repeat-containing protein n=1 Tax=Cohnella hongkongensis TaxID=178337 RepID=A0ABV9F5Y9_9BACL
MERIKYPVKTRDIKISFIFLMGVMILISNLPAFVKAGSSPGAIYYVAPWGSDAHEGTEAAPWKTIQHAADRLRPGEAVFVRGGIYQENITIKSFSDSGDYITFQAYPGETPVISGAESSSSSLVQFYGARNVIFDGFELTDFQVGDPKKYISAIKVVEGSSNLIIQNNHIHRIAHTDPNGNANGIVVYGNRSTAIQNVAIIGNYLHDLTLGSSEALTIVGNVDGFLVQNNVIERVNNIGIDVAGFYQTCSGSCVDQARNGVVAGNRVSYVDTIDNPAYRGYRAAAAIYVDGGASTVIEGNEVFYSNYGIEIASERKDAAASFITLRNNYIHHNQMSGLIMGGSSPDNGGARDNVVLNNTFYLNNQLRTGDGEITFQHHVQNNVFANNLLIAGADTPFIFDNRSTSMNNVFDYNQYFAVEGTSPSWLFQNVLYGSLDSYRQSANQDPNAIYADPMLRPRNDGMPELTAGSPAIDAGTRQYPQFGDFDLTASPRIIGNSIDIGAIEYKTSTSEPPTAPPQNPEPPIAPPHVPEPPTAPPQNPEPPANQSPFVIDGLSEDWDPYSPLATSDSNARTLKSAIVDGTLYVLLTGQLLKEKGQFYIRTDSLDSFAVPFWSNQQANYLIENGILYRYAGSGKDWSWERVKDYRDRESVINHSTIEMAIPLTDLSVRDKKQVMIGYIWKDSRNDQLPAGGAMAMVTGDSDLPQPTPEPTPAPVSVIQVDGRSEDWSDFPALAAKADRSLAAYVTNDSEYLYIAIQTNGSPKKNQVYIDSDNDRDSGYRSSRWKESGIDNLVENGALYRYEGDNKNWDFRKLSTLDNASYVNAQGFIEWKVGLKELGVGPGGTIAIGVMLDDQKSLKLPEEEALFEYKITK